MLQRLARFIDRSLPEDRFPDAEERRRGRVLISGSMVLSFVSLLVFVNTLLVPTSQLINDVGVGGLTLLFAAVPLVIRATSRVRLAGAWAVGWATLLLSALVASGGMRAPALNWIVLMPLLAHFFVGRAFALVILLASVVVVSVTYGLTLSGHEFSISYRGDQLTHLRWLSGIVFAITCTAVAALYDNARQRGLQLQQDINERLQEANDNLARARDEAEAANRAKSTFLATVSHELRTPLHGILAMSGALQAQPLTEVGLEQVRIVDRAAQSLNELIEDLLHLSNIEAGGVRLERRPWRIREGIADLTRVFGKQATTKQLDLVVDVAPDVPEAVQTDPLRVQQIIGNLVGNAVKFTEKGTVRLTLTWRPETSDPAATSTAASELVMTVSDTGPGIAPEVQQAIFDPFMRVDSSPTRRYGGTGLGLAISQKLADRMGGLITLESERGVGSTFTVRLPVKAVAPPEATVDHADAQPAISARKRILVADDSEICQLVLCQLLTPLGYDVVVVSDGQAALDALAASSFDIVLMDCEMPRMDGISAVRQLRATATTGPRVTVIAVTAHGLAEHREVCLEAGMDDLLGKPFRLAELQRMLDKWLEPNGLVAQNPPSVGGAEEPLQQG